MTVALNLFAIAGTPIIIAAFLFYCALTDPRKINWYWMTPGLIILGLMSLGSLCLASAGGFGVALAAGLGIFAAIPAAISGLVLLFLVRGKHKLFAGMIGLLFPAALLVGVLAGNNASPESRTERAGNRVVEALERYRADNGSYPLWLHELVPSYLADLKEPSTIWGWLYFPDTTEDEYALAWVTDVDRWVLYSFDAYRSNTGEWEHLMWPDVGPEFRLPETPMSARPIPSAMPTIFAYQSQIAPTISAWQTQDALTPTANP